MRVSPLPEVTTLDTRSFGQPGSACAYLIRADRTALVDAGTAAEAAHLARAVRGLRLDYIVVTHAHLDHAGGAGHLAREHPEALVLAHPRAVPHLADPTRLLAGVRTASPWLAPRYGEPLPVPAGRLAALRDGEEIALGAGCLLRALHTPGHAPHHVCYFEPSSRTLFLGDAAGHHAVLGDLPLTVPPRYDRVAGRASLERLAALEPRALAFAHYGIAVAQCAETLAAYPEHVDGWLDRVARLRAAGDETVGPTILADPALSGASRIDREIIQLCVRGALATLDAETASTSAPSTPAGPRPAP